MRELLNLSSKIIFIKTDGKDRTFLISSVLKISYLSKVSIYIKTFEYFLTGNIEGIQRQVKYTI